MLKKIRSLTVEHAIPAAFIIFVVFDLLMLGLGKSLSLLPKILPLQYLCELIIIVIPIAMVIFFGFSGAFKKGHFFRGMLYGLPFIVFQLIALAAFFSNNLGDHEASWKPWYLIVYSIVTVVGVGIREECVYRATFQNIVAKKHASSTKGIWIAVIVASLLFGLSHAHNLLYGVAPFSVLAQVIRATFVGLLFGAIYMRSGSLWVLILIHTLTDLAGLAKSTFLNNISDIEDINQLSFGWGDLVACLAYVALAAYLLRPSKCKQICENFCFAEEASESTTSI